jgi:hypothetical protein
MFTRAEKLAALEREIAMRKRVYPRFIAQNKMKQAEADRQVAIMEDIAEDYR